MTAPSTLDLPTHTMIDIESLGTRPGSLILSIGAVRFLPSDGEVPGVPTFDPRFHFYEVVSVVSAMACGLTIDGETLLWWMNPARAEAREAIFERASVPLHEALKGLAAFMRGSTHAWSHGAGFDLVLLEHPFRRCRIDPPWSYSQARDTRTIFDLAEHRQPGWRPRVEPPHHALQDAILQARDVQRAFRILNAPATAIAA